MIGYNSAWKFTFAGKILYKTIKRLTLGQSYSMVASKTLVCMEMSTFVCDS